MRVPGAEIVASQRIRRARVPRVSSCGPLDMGLDRLALAVDPTVRPRFFDHGGKILLPRRVAIDARPLTQRVLRNPGSLSVWQFGLAGGRLAHRIESIASALDHELECVKVVPVFER